jgi:hypothetical protein
VLQCSTNITPDDGKGKQREEPIHIQTPSDDLSFPAKFNSSATSALWKLLMSAREKGSKKAPVKITQDPFPEVVEANEAGMSQAHPSSHAGPAYTRTSSQVISGQARIFVMRRTLVLTICTRSLLGRLVLLLRTLPLIFPNVPVRLRPIMCGARSFHLDITHQQMIPFHCNHHLNAVFSYRVQDRDP